jgi:hypothetical protein
VNFTLQILQDKYQGLIGEEVIIVDSLNSANVWLLVHPFPDTVNFRAAIVNFLLQILQDKYQGLIGEEVIKDPSTSAQLWLVLNPVF